MKYRKISIYVDAEQFDSKRKPWPDGVEHMGFGEFGVEDEHGMFPIINGEWVVTEEGKRTVCSPDHFARTYRLLRP